MSSGVVVGVGVVLASGLLGKTDKPRRFEILSCNMSPTLQPGDRVHVRPAAGSVRAGDIVYFIPPKQFRKSDQDLRVSRAVAVGPARITSNGGRVLIDGKPETASYASGPQGAMPRDTNVSAGQVFVLGDFRQGSQDSRYYGPVDIADVQFVATGTVDSASERECEIEP